MTTNAPLKPVSPKSSTRSPLGKRLESSAKEVAAHIRGETKLTEYKIVVPDDIDVASLRARLNLSQSAFAKSFGLDLSAVQAWEQGRRYPDRTARILLAVIATEPQAVMRALSAGAA